MRDNHKIVFTTSASQNMLKTVLLRGATILRQLKIINISMELIALITWNFSSVFVGERGHQSSSDLEKLARTHNSLRVKYEGQYWFQILFFYAYHEIQLTRSRFSCDTYSLHKRTFTKMYTYYLSERGFT